MNIHPIFVHFPIALLTVYALLEILRFRFVQRIPGLVSIKAFLVIAGSIGAFVALQTGELAEEAVRSGPSSVRQLVETHSMLATNTSIIFSILAIAYIVSLLNMHAQGTRFMKIVSGEGVLAPIWRLVSKIADFVMKPIVVVVLAFLGLVAVTMTGALGGAIVYGPDVDPVVRFVYGLFF